MKEKWVHEIPGFEKCSDYKVRTDGVVISYKISPLKPRELKPYPNTKGYPLVDLGKNKRAVKVHRLVLLAFLRNPENKPQVNHIDGNKKNNHIDNLEWVTNSENQMHACESGLKSRRLTEKNIKWIFSNWGMITAEKMSRVLKYDVSTLYKLYKGKLKSYNNLILKYKNII